MPKRGSDAGRAWSWRLRPAPRARRAAHARRRRHTYINNTTTFPFLLRRHGCCTPPWPPPGSHTYIRPHAAPTRSAHTQRRAHTQRPHAAPARSAHCAHTQRPHAAAPTRSAHTQRPHAPPTRSAHTLARIARVTHTQSHNRRLGSRLGAGRRGWDAAEQRSSRAGRADAGRGRRGPNSIAGTPKGGLAVGWPRADSGGEGSRGAEASRSLRASTGGGAQGRVRALVADHPRRRWWTQQNR